MKPINGYNLSESGVSVDGSGRFPPFDKTAAFLEEFRILTLKTTCGNRERLENVARGLTSAKGLASTRKRAANGGRREGVGAKRTIASASKHNVSCICPVCEDNYYDENEGQERVQCYDSCSSWFHAERVELKVDYIYCWCCCCF
ncbi:hypothetical protein TNCV_3769251 [Trichonephila clavipes]|nr:hypothetical protein TNCV_3769251 [Trichonephila clavipes]